VTTGHEYSDLVTLSTIVSSSIIFKSEESDNGLPPAAFLFVELLCWFAQAIRSGVWTYYEATPNERQLAFERVLREFAPLDFSYWFNRGTADWKDEAKIKAVDEWIEMNDERCNRWLREFTLANRDLFIDMGT
jgi:hypothetical protein